MTTTNTVQASNDEGGDLKDVLATIRTMLLPDRAEIKVGSMASFAAWCEQHVGSTVRTKPQDSPAAATLMGVQVKVSALLPPNRASLFVNGELRAIIDLDGPDDTRPGGRE